MHHSSLGSDRPSCIDPANGITAAESPQTRRTSIPRRTMLAAIPAAMLGGVVACSSKSTTGNTSTPNATPNHSSTSASAGTGTGSVTLTYGLWDQAQVPAMKKIINEFHKANPTISVTITVTPFATYWTKLQTAATGGSAPDVFWLNIPNSEFYAANNVLLPLTSRIKAAKIDLSQLEDTITKAYTYKGDVWGMPKDIDSIALWYNKSLFAQANVRLPDASWTWSDLLGAGRALTNKHVFGFAAPLSDQQNIYNSVPQAGGYVISPDHRKSGLDLPQSVTGIEFWTDMILKEHISPTLAQMTDTNPQQMFESGKIAMYYDGAWTVEAEKLIPYAVKHAALAPMAKGPKGTNISVSNGLANVIYAKTKHPDEAWKFVAFLGSKRAADIQAESGTVIPAYKASQAAWVKAYPQFDAKVFTDALKTSYSFPASYNSAAWENYADKTLISAWTGKQSTPSVCANIAKQMNTALAKEPH